ncbi:MAG: M6 family metalloprotease domain-containing protein, partial [Candidatus Muiribacteriota bacterium]
MKKIILFITIFIFSFTVFSIIGNDGRVDPDNNNFSFSNSYGFNNSYSINQVSPVSGAISVFVIRVDFDDYSWVDGQADMTNIQNSLSNVTSYFNEVSYTNVAVNFTISDDIYTLGNLSTYGGEGRYSLIDDAFEAVSHDVNFGDYDYFSVMHAHTGEEFSGSGSPIWSCAILNGNFGPYNNGENSNVIISTGSIVPSWYEHSSIIGVIAHELGHQILKLPDYYDTSKQTSGVGNGCLMGVGSWNGSGALPAHLNAYSKMKLGWINPTVIENFYGVENLNSASNEPVAFKLGGKNNEYWVVEVRGKNSGFDSIDSGLIGGMYIWHVDDNKTANNQHNDRLLRLVQADGSTTLCQTGTTNNEIQASDVFGGHNNYIFNKDRSVYKDGTITNIVIKDIEGFYYSNISMHINTYEMINFGISSSAGGSVSCSLITGYEESGKYTKGSIIEIEITEDEGYEFYEWDVTSGYTPEKINDNTYRVILMENTYIEAIFHCIVFFEISVSSIGNGSITPNGNFEIMQNQSVTFTVTPDEGYKVKSFKINGVQTSNYSISKVVEDCNVEVVFERIYYNLRISSNVSGVESTIPANGNHSYPSGEKVRIFIQPDEFNEFVRWSGDVSGVEDIYSSDTFVEMDSNYSITPVLKKIEVNLAVNIQGEGSYSKSADTIYKGEPVTLSVTPAKDYIFYGYISN